MIQKYIVIKEVLGCKPKTAVIYDENRKIYVSEVNDKIDFTPNQVLDTNYFSKFEIPEKEQSFVNSVIIENNVPYTITQVYYEFIGGKKVYFRCTSWKGYGKDDDTISVPYHKKLRFAEFGYYINSTGQICDIINTSTKNNEKVGKLKHYGNWFKTKELASEALVEYISLFASYKNENI